MSFSDEEDMSNPGPTKKINAKRILIADDEILLAQRLAEYLESKGFLAQVASKGPEALGIVNEWYPDLVLYDLMLPELNAVQFLRQMKGENGLRNGKMKVLVTSGHSNQQNIQECLKFGAADYLPKRMPHNDILARIILNIQSKVDVTSFAPQTPKNEQSAHYYMHLTDLALRESLKETPLEESLHNLTGMLGIAMKAVRVSVMACDLEAKKAYVIASNDKRSIGRLEIELSKYPEVLHVLTSQKLLALDNVAADPTMHFVRNVTKDINFNSLVVAPIKINGSLWGVLSIRMPDTKKNLDDFEIRYAALLANVMGLAIRSNEAVLNYAANATESAKAIESDKSRNSA